MVQIKALPHPFTRSIIGVMRSAVSSISSLVLIIAISASAGAAPEFRDCEKCPVMVTAPAGVFKMGTAVADRLIDPRTGKPATNDSPQHEVTIDAPFAIGKYEVTVEEFGVFVTDTGYETVDRCMAFSKPDSFTINNDLNWKETGFNQTGDHPVVCVSFFDAEAYAIWLRDKTGETYRLPSEAEWEYTARAGSTTSYHWGTDSAKTCEYANVRSQGAYAISKRQAAADREEGFPCDDGVRQSSATGSYAPNDFGLHDVQGNAWEWVADCNHKDYDGAPADGSAWLDEPDEETRCPFGVIRGGSYLNLVERSSTTVRAGRPRSGAATNMGFRVTRGGSGGNEDRHGPDWASDPIIADPDSTGNRGEQLFAENCAACHVERATFSGVYGKDQQSVETAIRGGGNNTMSMPAFGEVLEDKDIEALAGYVRELNGW